MQPFVLVYFFILFLYPLKASISKNFKDHNKTVSKAILNDSSLTFNNDYKLSIEVVSSFLETPNSDFKSTIFSPALYYENNYENNLLLNINFGVSFLDIDRESFGQFQSVDISNILLGVGYNLNKDVSNHIKISLITGIPTALFYSNDIDKKKLSEFNYLGVISSEGWSNPYLWLINTVPLIVSKYGLLEIYKNVNLDFRISPSYLVSLNSRPSRFALLSSFNLGIGFNRFAVKVGLNNYISSINIENNDYSQSSARLGLNFRSSKYELGLDYFLNIDPPYSFINSTNKINWGLGLSILFFNN